MLNIQNQKSPSKIQASLSFSEDELKKKEFVIEDLHSRIKRIEKNAESNLEKELSTLKLSLESIHSDKVSTLDSQISQLTIELQASKAQASKYESDIIVINTKASQRIEELEDRVKASLETGDDRIRSIEAFLEVKESENAKQSQRIKDLEAEAEALTDDVDRLRDWEKKADDAQESVRNLLVEVEELKAQIDTLKIIKEKEIEGRQQIQKLTTEKSLLSIQVSDLNILKSKHEAATKQIEELNVRIEDLKIKEAELVKARELADVNEKNIEALNSELEVLRPVVDKFESCEKARNEGIEKISKLQEELKSIKEELNNKSSDLEQSIKRTNELLTQVQSLGDEVNKLEDEKSELEKDLKIKHESSLSSEKQLQVKYKAAKEEMTLQFQAKLNELKTELTRAHQTREAAQASHTVERQKLLEETDSKVKKAEVESSQLRASAESQAIELSSLKSDLSSAAYRLDESEVARQAMMARVADLGKTVDDLKATLETKDEEYTQMEDEVDTLREIVKTREVQMSQEQDTAEKAKKSEIELKNQMEILGNQKSQAEQDKQRLEGGIEILRKEVAQLNENIEQLEEKAKVYESTIEKIELEKNQLAEEFRIKIEESDQKSATNNFEWQAKVSELEETSHQLQAKLSTANTDLQARMTRETELSATVDDLKATLETKDEEYTQMEDEVDTLREIVKTREVQMSQEKDTAEEARQEAKATQVMLLESELLIEDLKNNVTRLSSVEVSLKDEKTNLEKQLGGLRVKIEKFKTQAENSKTEKSQIEDSLSSRIESQVKDIAERDIQISQLSDKYRQSEKIAQDRAEVITLLNERLETIETEKLGSIRDRDNTAKDSADKTREISTLRAKIDEIVSDREALKVRLESDISALRHQQASAQTDHEQTADGHRSTIATLEMAMVDMGRRLTQAIADEQMAKVRIDDKNAQIDAKNSEIDIMQLNIDKLKADIDGLNAGIDNVKREAETSEKRIIDESRERIEKLEVDHTREIQRLETNKKDAFESWKEQKNHLDMQIRDLGISKDTEHAEKLAALDEDHRQIIDKCKKEAREEIEVKIEEEAKKWENEFREMVKSKDAKFQDALSLHKQEMQERVDIIRAEVNQQHSETLESELAALKHKLIMEHNSLLNATKKALEDAIETQKHELEYQLSELTRDKDAIIHKYETECQNLQAKYDQIKSEYQLSNKQWTIRESELVHSIDSLKVEHDSIKEQENSKEQIILDLKNKLEEIQSELNESQTSNNQSLSEVNSISEQLRKVREDLRNTQDSKIETEESLIKEKESTAQLESEKCVLHNTVAELTNDLERLKTESSQFESKLNQTIEVMAQIKNDLNVANESLLSLEIQAQDEKQQSARALDDLNKRLNTKDERISALTHEMNEMTSQISAKDERLASLSQEISDLSSKNKSSENLIEKLKKNITAKDEEINGLKVVDQDSKAEISRLTSELSNLASSTAAKDKGIERLEAELQRTKESIKAARDTESSEMQNVIDSLREQLEKSIAEANFANDKSTSLSAEVESIKLEKKKIGKEFSALVLKLTASTAEFEQKVAENEQLKEKIDNIETNSKINEKDLSEKIKNMTAEYSSKMAVAAKKHQDELITHKKDHEALVSQLESASASTQSLTKELQAAQKFLQAEKVKLKDIQSELDEVKATSKQRESHNQAALTSKQQSIATLEASVSRLSNDNAALRDKLKAADSEVVRETGRRRTSEDELRAELAMLTAGHSSELKAVKVKMDEESKTMCESVKAELEAEKSKLEMSVLKLQKEFEATKIKLKERDSELAFVKTDLQSNSATKDKEVTTLRHQIEETTRGIADLKVELSKSKSLIVQLEADLKSRTESVGMMEEQIKEKSKQIDDLRQTLSIEASKSKEASEKNRNKLENDLLEANLKADKATMMNNTLRKQVEDSQTELEKVMNELGNFKKSATAGNSVQNEKDVLIQKVTADLMRVVLDL